MINLVVLDGTLGRDVELKSTTTGKSVANFSIAVDNGFGENKKDPFWFNVVAWGSLAEVAGNQLRKGSKLTVYGRLTTRKYTNKTDVEVTVTEVVANAFEVRKTDKSEDRKPAGGGQSYRPQTNQVADEDIPF
jgi:single-strand DNA-binding protein